ncbi:IS630 transposase-related protein [Ignatzschineria sp. LJL83]
MDPEKLSAFIKDNPDAYLSELAEEFQCATSSIHEALVKLGFTRKKKSIKYWKLRLKKRMISKG